MLNPVRAYIVIKSEVTCFPGIPFSLGIPLWDIKIHASFYYASLRNWRQLRAKVVVGSNFDDSSSWENSIGYDKRLGPIQQFWSAEPDTEPNWMVLLVCHDTLCWYVPTLLRQRWLVYRTNADVRHITLKRIRFRENKAKKGFITELD